MNKPVVMFNPYTGTPRHPLDIESDPQGLLIWDGETPLYAFPLCECNEQPTTEEMDRKKCSACGGRLL